MARKQFNTGDIPSAADFNKFAQMQNDTAANWTSANPILALGDVGYETDTKKLKIGDGVTAWSALSYRLSDPANMNATGGTIGGASVAAVAAAARLSLSNYGPANPLYIAHRGSAALYPEESPLAYGRALADGEVILEGDVQTLSDGALGMMHDGTVDRTTTATGNVSSFTAATFGALTMDSSAWLGSNYGDTLNPQMFQAWVDTFKGRAMLMPEDKDFASMAALVKVLVNSGVPFDQALVQCFQTSNLAVPVNAGFQACGLASAGSPTAAAIAATGAQWAGLDVADSPTTYLAAGLKVLFYTVNRRYLRDQLLAAGASGLCSDDPKYLRSSAPMSAGDYFGRQTWAPGMLGSSNDFGTNIADRGVFSAPNYWGYNVTTAGHLGCLQGYLCPVANPQQFTLNLKLTWDGFNVGTSFISYFIGTSDRPWNNGADQSSGYVIRFFPTSGNVNIYRKDAGSLATLIGSTTTLGLSLSTEYTFQVLVTPTTVGLARTSGSSQFTFSVNDTAYRGGYLQLGRDGISCRFRSLQVA